MRENISMAKNLIGKEINTNLHTYVKTFFEKYLCSKFIQRYMRKNPEKSNLRVKLIKINRKLMDEIMTLLFYNKTLFNTTYPFYLLVKIVSWKFGFFFPSLLSVRIL